MKEYFLIDGYDFGGKLLESVMFKAFVNKSRTKVTKIEPHTKDDTEFFFLFNRRHWLKIGKESTQDTLEEMEELVKFKRVK